MTTSRERALVDTNVLVHAYNLDAKEHLACRRLIEDGGTGELDAVLRPQILLEFVVAITHPKKVKNPPTLTRALAWAAELADTLDVVQPPEDLATRVFLLLRSRRFGRTQTYDMAIAATAFANGITRIYTYDKVFHRVPGMTVLQP